MINVVCPNDGTILGQADSQEMADDILSNTKCSVCGWEQTQTIEKTEEELLEETADDHMVFGEKLYRSIKKKVWAINVKAKDLGNPLTTEQMISLIQTSNLLKDALESGSLPTAKLVIQQLKQAFPQYGDVAEYATAEINTYLGIT